AALCASAATFNPSAETVIKTRPIPRSKGLGGYRLSTEDATCMEYLATPIITGTSSTAMSRYTEQLQFKIREARDRLPLEEADEIELAWLEHQLFVALEQEGMGVRSPRSQPLDRRGARTNS